MGQHVIETVTFRAEAGVSKERMLEAARQAVAFTVAQPGFVSRRLSLAEDGTWMEHVEWETMEAAQAAAIGKDERAGAFMKAIDGPSVRMTHSVLEVSIG